MIEVKIEGLEEIQNKLKRMYEKDKVLFKGTILEATLKGEAEAKKVCPVDTGRLRSSITHRIEEFTGIIGTNVEYAPYVEFGTRKMRAKPYLRPSGEKAVEWLKSKLIEILKR